MAQAQITPEFLIIFIVGLVTTYIYHTVKIRSSDPVNWPFVGMIPALLRNAYDIFEYGTRCLIRGRGTFVFKGPWFANMDMVITSDPANIHHILTKNFVNYPKGDEFRKIFDFFREAFFNADAELWSTHRRTILSLLNQSTFKASLKTIIRTKAEQGLIPVLDLMAEQGVEFDLQDIFQRFSFDAMCMVSLGFNPDSLSVSLPDIACEKAFTALEEALFYRHIIPESLCKDTISTALTWFFFLLAKNPVQHRKIREETRTRMEGCKGEIPLSFGETELHELVYLHGGLCETLRLYPPVPMEHKASVKQDILPSGHKIDPGAKIILSFYSMGRMETIWGKDCLEFKPERWISELGETRNHPSFKFTAFLSGPRACVGKEMAFTHMTMVAATIIYMYDFKLVEGHPILPSSSIVLEMKHGLKVKLIKRRQ